MLICTTWKTRPLNAAQTSQFMERWGKIEADMEASPSIERIGFYMFGDGSGGLAISKVDEAGLMLSLELGLALGEFVESDMRVIVDMESAAGAIANAVARVAA